MLCSPAALDKMIEKYCSMNKMFLMSSVQNLHACIIFETESIFRYCILLAIFSKVWVFMSQYQWQRSVFHGDTSGTNLYNFTVIMYIV